VSRAKGTEAKGGGVTEEGKSPSSTGRCAPVGATIMRGNYHIQPYPARHLAAKVDMVELAAVGRRCCCCIGPKTRCRGCTQAIGESIINEGIESDCTLLGDDEALS
jgi:hypothetical protein